MALAKFNNPEEQSPSPSFQEAQNQPISKSLGIVFGYMAIGLAISFAIALGLSLALYYGLGQRTFDEAVASFEGATDPIVVAYTIILVVAFAGLFITSFVMGKSLASPSKSAWPAFIVYASFMGVLLSAFVMLVDPLTLVEALGITTLVFGVMFLIGRFSKINLNPLGLIAIGALIMMILLSLFWSIFYWVNQEAFKTFDLVFSIVVCALMMIITAVDAYNIKNILARGQSSKNVYLYCAFILYSDFITLLIRILSLLSRLKSRD